MRETLAGIQYEVNDKTLAGQILDKIIAEDCGLRQLIFDHGSDGTSHTVLFYLVKLIIENSRFGSF